MRKNMHLLTGVHWAALMIAGTMMKPVACSRGVVGMERFRQSTARYVTARTWRALPAPLSGTTPALLLAMERAGSSSTLDNQRTMWGRHPRRRVRGLWQRRSGRPDLRGPGTPLRRHPGMRGHLHLRGEPVPKSGGCFGWVRTLMCF